MFFNELDYRNHIKLFIDDQKKRGLNYGHQDFAKAIGVQKAYLSKVLSGNAQLNSDQVYLAEIEMKLDKDEIIFFRLIWEMDRTALHQRKEEILKEINHFKSKKNKTEGRIKVESVNTEQKQIDLYYTDPLNQIIHIALGLDRYKDNYWKLANDLSIKKEKLTDSLKTLEGLGLIEWGEKIILLKNDIHLPRSSTLFWAWKSQLALLSLQKYRYLSEDKSYNFSVTFSCDQKTRQEIQDQFFIFLNKTKELVQKSKSKEGLHQMNFDLFDWL
jgi:uncharacterized protein (TIGR02147 family)